MPNVSFLALCVAFFLAASLSPSQNDAGGHDAPVSAPVLKALRLEDPAALAAALQDPQAKEWIATLDFDGHPPLFHALAANHLEMCRALLNAGAEPNQLGLDGSSALLIASRLSSVEILKLLVEKGADWNDYDAVTQVQGPLAGSVGSGDVEKLRFALENWPDAPEPEHQQALATACADGNLEMIRLLIAQFREHQWEIDFVTKSEAIRPKKGDIHPLAIAIRNGNQEAAEYLIQHHLGDFSSQNVSLAATNAVEGDQVELLRAVLKGRLDLSLSEALRKAIELGRMPFIPLLRAAMKEENQDEPQMDWLLNRVKPEPGRYSVPSKALWMGPGYAPSPFAIKTSRAAPRTGPSSIAIVDATGKFAEFV